MIEQKFEDAAMYTSPILVEEAGGVEKFAKLCADSAASLKTLGLTIESYQFGQPSRIERKGSGLYAVLPTTATMRSDDGKVGRQSSYWLAVSGSEGRDWMFIDGQGTHGDRAQIRRYLPGFPDSLSLPQPQPVSFDGS
jgi:hypothetical protein